MTTPEDVARAVGVTSEFVTVRWVCRNYRAAGLSMFDALGLCGREFTTEAKRTEVAARQARARCPAKECGRMLTQASDGCEVLG